MKPTSRSRRWEYSDAIHVKGYRSAARSVAWLAMGMFLSMYVIYTGILFISIIFLFAGSFTPDMLSDGNTQALEELYNNIINQVVGNEIFSNSLTIIVSLLSVVIPLLFYRTLRKRKLNILGFFKPVLPKKAPLAVILAFGIGYLATYAAMLFFTLLSGIGINVLTPELPFPTTTAGIILYFIGVGIVAPVVEEIMFRGVMLRELKPYGNAAAIVIPSLLFGFIHGTPYAFFYATAIGLVLAYMTIKTGSILYSVITHMLFNIASFVLQYLSSIRTEFEASIINSGYEIIIFAISAASLIWLVRTNYDLSLPSPSSGVISRQDYKAGMRRPVVIIFFAMTILISLTQFYMG